VSHVRFADEQDGWAFGPALYATHDGGATWSRERLGGPVLALEPAGRTVWAVAGGRLWAAEVPSDRWRALREATGPPGSLVDLARAGPGRAWLLWRAGAWPARVPSRLVMTADGGRSWSRGSVPCGGWNNEEVLAVAGRALWLVCGNEPGGGSEEKRLYLSMDGGRKWVSRGWAPYSGYTVVLAAVSARAAWFADIGSPVLRTTDGGRTWRPVVSVDDNSGWSSMAVHGRFGWIAYRDVVYGTTDGGRRWSHRRITPSGCG
jgi:photosystem II stability/assembly factor-like uncharacterized protein